MHVSSSCDACFFVTAEALIFDAVVCISFFRRHFTAGNMVLAGAGVDHEELVRLGAKYFGGITAGEGGGDSGAAGLAESRYIGGESRNVVSADKVQRTSPLVVR